ncbi:PREDICTED: hemoglobin subunit theta-1 [Elephantulus edwardii]|uniref:hemoglobin subunit theta-1 n=1 Tax=Elephantulus edwardii TaxID=28737 RepID=UPI0003F0E70B|nr:PREDICTED: hemoglobin subunit theta-1 [Elephantulus edwardii]
MALSAREREAVTALWRKMGNNVGVYTTEALERTFIAFPTTKIYFHHLNLTPGSKDIKAQGKKVADALTQAVDQLDDLPGALSELRDLHSHKLKVDPINFQHFGHCLLVTLARHYPGDFSPVMQASVDKFLSHVTSVMISKCC